MSSEMFLNLFLQLKRIASLLFLLLFFNSLLAELASAHPSEEACDPKSCGSGPNISYPFWIEGQQPNFCGLPDFTVTCKENSPVLSISEEEFHVWDIFYRNKTFLLSRDYVVDGSCHFPSRNLTLEGNPFSINSTYNRNLSFFINCSKDASLPLAPIPCRDDGRFNSYVGVDLPEEYRDKLPKPCASVVTAQFAPNSWGNISGRFGAGSYYRFLLNYVAPDCDVCEQSGGRCGFNSETYHFMCICSDRIHISRCRKRFLHYISVV